MPARIFKRSFDILFSLFIIIFFFSWLCPILAILIKIESPGPVFFVQRRTGRHNTTFKCYKFRSMYVNSESDSRQASRNDGRVTGLGSFLRKTSLDELPQFFNVLIGNMSIVGPRPHMISHAEKYSRLTEQYEVRHTLRPGITGLAQVSGLRGELPDQDALLKLVSADVWYLQNRSFLLDLRIIFLTFWLTLRGDKNAY
ncbi:MAG: sugar transferase [Bacteroidetes bacterium]|nr:sugar transferase [Bacteroidota bacterium]